MNSFSVLNAIVLLIPLFSSAFAQRTQGGGGVKPGRADIQVQLEQRLGGTWEAVDAHTVFRASDEIRFRFRSSFPGFLLVINHASDGATTWLFPRSEQGQRSRVEAGSDYLVPGTKGSFLIAGKSGFDVTDWIVSSLPLDPRWPAASEFGSQPSTLIPRCPTDQAREQSCLDDRAGPGPISKALPSQLSGGPPHGTLIARDLAFRQEGDSTVISVPGMQRSTVVYEFRIAHR